MKNICIFGIAIVMMLLSCNENKSEPEPIDVFKKEISDNTFNQLQNRLKQVNENVREKGMVFDSIRQEKLLTGYSYGEFYDWDLYFENIYLSYYGISEFCFSNLNVFLSLQHENGFIPRSFGTKNYGAKEMFKPFIAQIVLLGSLQEEDFSWAKEKYPNLKKYIQRWMEYDSDDNGLMYWGEFGTGENGAYHSGMDNQFSRTVGRSEGVDLNSYLVRELEAMAVIASQLQKPDEAIHFSKQATTLSNKINEILWDEATGFYYDRNEETGEMSTVKSISGFAPLWSKVASKEQASILVKEHLTNPKEFWTNYPVPTYAIDEDDYYQGSKSGECNWRGSSWVPTNHMMVHGLKSYSYDSLANVIAYKTFDMVLNKNETTREFFNAETGEGYGLKPFYGWSTLAYFMPLEVELDYNPTLIDEDLKILKLGDAIDGVSLEELE
ncbi:MAG: trehalase family glycosidase [Psychroflexus sp.]